MGGCITIEKQKINSIEKNKFHIIIYQTSQSSNGLVNLKNPPVPNLTSHFELTKPAYIVFDPSINDQKNHIWTDSLILNSTMSSKIIIGINQTNKDLKSKTRAFLKNSTYENYGVNLDLWEVIPQTESNTKNPGFELKENDIIRIGHQQIKLTILVKTDQENQNIYENYPFRKILKNNNNNNNVVINSSQNLLPSGKSTNALESTNKFIKSGFGVSKDKMNLIKCAICLQFEGTNKFFISVCDCTKKSPVHLSCFRQSLIKNLGIHKTRNMTVYDLGNIECNKCGCGLSPYFVINGVQDLLIDLVLPQKQAYSVFEFYSVNNSSILKAIMVIDTYRDCFFSMGRSNLNDIMFKHFSISKKHATLTIFKKSVYLVDENSMYGTMKLVPKGHEINDKRNVTFIASNWIIEVHPFDKETCDCFDENTPLPIIHSNPFEKDVMKKVKVDLTKETVIDHRVSNMLNRQNTEDEQNNGFLNKVLPAKKKSIDKNVKNERKNRFSIGFRFKPNTSVLATRDSTEVKTEQKDSISVFDGKKSRMSLFQKLNLIQENHKSRDDLNVSGITESEEEEDDQNNEQSNEELFKIE